ncbi:hypothetical protein CPB83DRAFT_146625 [Crepidotus variabilis]|uniref:DUF6697 domain-containing protein n=1 Tax=Crepidotus variabilis TaxID=179855 RepID=A0A9P6ELF5_9AGAR|nr:hypothetical protein CPB83DRAFT_146625 [Crepidotus variabilis]
MAGLALTETKDERDDDNILLGPTQAQHTGVDEIETEKLKKMFKSKVKKHEEMRLSDDVFLQRIRPLNILDGFPVTLEREFRDQLVPRKFMSNVYGGSSQMTFPHPRSEKIAEHGYDDFMCLPLDYQPFAPQVPGKPGLFLSTAKGDDIEEPKRVFTRDPSRALRQYMGQYEVKATDSLSREEWLAQPDKVRNTWGREITRQGWGVYVCARIQARKELRRGAQLTQAKLDDVIESERYTRTTPEDVIAAYDSGVERLDVWTMKCIAYEADFQVDLCRKFAAWVPPPKRERKQKALPKRKNGVKQETQAEKASKSEMEKEVDLSAPLQQRSSRGKKRKRAATPESEADEDFEDEEDNEAWATPIYRQETSGVIEILDSDEEEVAVYRFRGTKSRPSRK